MTSNHVTSIRSDDNARRASTSHPPRRSDRVPQPVDRFISKSEDDSSDEQPQLPAQPAQPPQLEWKPPQQKLTRTRDLKQNRTRNRASRKTFRQQQRKIAKLLGLPADASRFKVQGAMIAHLMCGDAAAGAGDAAAVDLSGICGLDESIFDGPLASLELDLGDVDPFDLSVLDNAPDLLGKSTEFPNDLDFGLP